MICSVLTATRACSAIRGDHRCLPSLILPSRDAGLRVCAYHSQTYAKESRRPKTTSYCLYSRNCLRNSAERGQSPKSNLFARRDRPGRQNWELEQPSQPIASQLLRQQRGLGGQHLSLARMACSCPACVTTGSTADSSYTHRPERLSAAYHQKHFCAYWVALGWIRTAVGREGGPPL